MQAKTQATIDALDTLPRRVMVVDDEVLIRLVAADMLHDAGFAVVEACSADEAVTLLATNVHFDLIVTDVRMPGSMDGLGLLAYVRRRYPTIPVVLTSGHLSTYELLRAGASGVMPKPYSEAALVGTIERVLGRSGG